MRRLFALVLLAALAGQAQPPPSMRPPILRDVGIDQKLDSPVPLGLAFRDETGRPVELREYFGRKPVVLSLVYYECPMLCTMVLNGVVRSLRALSFTAGREFEVITVSINPRETPALAAQKKAIYMEHYRRPEAAAGWHFLTGEESQIKLLADTVGFRYAYDPATQLYVHASGILVLTPAGRVARYFYGLEYSARDLRLGLVEASAGKIGSPVDQVLLFCYHYDPATGRYGAAVMKTVRAAGLATVAALGMFLFMMFRRDRRRRELDA